MLSKMKTSIVVAALMLAISSSYASNADAKDNQVNPKIEAIQASLKDLPAVEIPAQAAKLVKEADKASQLETAKAVLQGVLAQRPQMVVQLVASLVKAAPETAPGVTSLAVSIVPQFADVIIRAAVISAPKYASEIAVAATQVFPDNKADIVKLVSVAVPASADRVASAVAKAPVRLTSGAAADNHATGGIIVQKKTGITEPFPNQVVDNKTGGTASFDTKRYD